MATWRALATVPPWPVDRLRHLPGQCRGSVVRDWATLAGPTAGVAVRAQFVRDGLQLPDVADAAWLPAHTHLRLHDLLAEQLCAGDRVAFGDLWLQMVAARISQPARWMARQFGLQRSVAWLTAHWPSLWDVPPPSVTIGDRALVAQFAGHPLFDHPTWQWLTALQATLLLEVLVGAPVQIDAQSTAGQFALHASW